MPAKIALGGFQHETNTFAPHLAHYEDFVKPDGWPALTRGEDLFSAKAGLNIPLAGFIEAAQSILAVKRSVHFGADFDPIAAETLVVAVPGVRPYRLVDLPYQNLRRGVRLEPMGPEH